MRPRLVSAETTVTEHSSFEESFTFENEITTQKMDEKTLKERIRELEAEQKAIESETKEEERAIRQLSAVVNDITVKNKETKESLDNALSWPNSLLQNSEKWLAIWGSELGKVIYFEDILKMNMKIFFL
uniref:Uncharacterized protein n=1 Tax=Panagrolaimus davidi TaxID=227884 RepID=A0A914QGN6_9BILA